MSIHTRFEELLPFFVAGQLPGDEKAEIENHLAGCEECQAELIFWQAVSVEVITTNDSVVTPQALAARALERVRPAGFQRNSSSLKAVLRRTWGLLVAQAFLVQREMWPSSAAVMALGVIVALISKHVQAIYFIAPLVAAASLSILSGPEHDAGYELALASPTSSWKLLLARLSIVSAYNLLLALAATLVLLFIVPPGLLGTLALTWLGPMAFLSTLALLLSLLIGTSNAVAITYVLWIAQYAPINMAGLWVASPGWERVVIAYQQFWHNPVLLLSLSIFLIGLSLWSAGRPVFGQPGKTVSHPYHLQHWDVRSPRRKTCHNFLAWPAMSSICLFAGQVFGLPTPCLVCFTWLFSYLPLQMGQVM